jgi:hypothetical protein
VEKAVVARNLYDVAIDGFLHCTVVLGSATESAGFGYTQRWLNSFSLLTLDHCRTNSGDPESAAIGQKEKPISVGKNANWF